MPAINSTDYFKIGAASCAMGFLCHIVHLGDHS
jgi:hypothetical protein